MAFTVRRTVTYANAGDTILHQIGSSDEGHRLVVNATPGTQVPINHIATAPGGGGRVYNGWAEELARKTLPADTLVASQGVVKEVSTLVSS